MFYLLEDARLFLSSKERKNETCYADLQVRTKSILTNKYISTRKTACFSYICREEKSNNDYFQRTECKKKHTGYKCVSHVYEIRYSHRL